MTGMDRITPTARVRAVLGGAYGAAVRASGVGTEHLLVALADRDAGPAGEVLDEYQVTPVVATAMLRTAAGAWHDGDRFGDGGGSLAELEWYGRRKPMNYTTALGVAPADVRARLSRA